MRNHLLIVASVYTIAAELLSLTREGASDGWSFAGVDIERGHPAGAWHPDWLGLTLLLVALALAIWTRRGGRRAIVAGVASVVLALLAAGSLWLSRNPIGLTPVDVEGTPIPFAIGVVAMSALGAASVFASARAFRRRRSSPDAPHPPSP